MLLDGIGKLIRYIPHKGVFDFALQKNGTVTFSDSTFFYVMDSTFTVTDTLRCTPPYETDRHDLQLLHNGNRLFLGTESVTVDVSAYPYWKKKFNRDSALLRFGIIQEQDVNGKVVFEWHSKDYFKFNDVDSFHFRPVTKLLFDNQFPFDWTHFNAIEADHDGNILVSSRNYNAIIKINRQTGEVMWQLGGKQNQFQFINCPVPFYGQHDIRRISNGHITLFDNGDHYTPHGAGALEFMLDEKNKTATLVWSYTFNPGMSSRGRGNVQRLDHNRTLICYGKVKTNPVCFVLIDSVGNKLVQLDSVFAYRVHYYPALPWKPSAYSN